MMVHPDIQAVINGDRRWCVVTANCMDVLPALPDGCVDAVVTDPPYGVNYKYNAAFDDSPEAWCANTTFVWPELARVATGPILWFAAAPTMKRDLNTFPEQPQRTMIWAPRFSLSITRSCGMYFRWHVCYGWRLPQRHDGPHFDLWEHSTECGNWWKHPGTKPLALMRELVRIAEPNDVVLDPYAGSGTTGVACIAEGRRFIGIEIDDHYADIARRRIEAEESQANLFDQAELKQHQSDLF